LAKKQRITLIGSLCKGCGYCIEFCPNKVFEKSEEMNEKGGTALKLVATSKAI